MFLLLVLCLQIQAEGTQKPEDPPPQPPAALERIRRALESPPRDLIDGADRDIPVFRVYIREKPLPPQRLWTDDAPRPSFEHTHFPLYHHEFLSTVTPEEFRAATLYPIGFDVLPIIEGAIKMVRQALHEQAEARARSRVQQELRMLLDARKEAQDVKR